MPDTCDRDLEISYPTDIHHETLSTVAAFLAEMSKLTSDHEVWIDDNGWVHHDDIVLGGLSFDEGSYRLTVWS